MQELSFEKFVFLGDSGVGKSRILQSLATHYASEVPELDSIQPKPAKPVLQHKNVPFGSGKVLQLWDSDEYRRPGIFRKIYLQRTKVYLIVFDLSRSTSFASCQQYLEMVLESKSNSSQVLLIGTKLEDSQLQVSIEEAEEWCNQRDCFFMELDMSAFSPQLMLSKFQEVLDKAAFLE